MAAVIQYRDPPGPIPSFCPQCRKPNDGSVEIRIQNTAYVEEIDNWATCCEDCQEENDDHWDEMWQEYYRSRL